MFFGAFTVFLLAGWPNRDTVEIVSALVFPLLGLLYVPLAVLAALSARGRLRAAWLTFAIGLSTWALGDVVSGYYAVILGREPFPSWADAGYLAYIPIVVTALVLFPSTRSWRDQGRMVLDGLILAGSIFVIAWLAVMRTAWHSGGTSGPAFAISLAYPAGDVLIVTVCILVLLRVPPGLRFPLILLLAGLVAATVADSVWAYLWNSAGHAVGSLPNILYAASVILIIVALVAAQHAEPGPATAARPPGLFALWLPLVPLAAAAVFMARTPPNVVIETPVAATGVLIVMATLIRQLLEAAESVRRERHIRVLADQLAADLDSAANYVASILPGDLTGPVEVSSRYLPARAVGGDSFGYTWVDDDHLIVYLIDASGHGVEPALLSVSVHNLLRSGSLPTPTLLEPDRVLAELNDRFSMESHHDHYFTMWYGVYRLSTGQLRYASAGHPPALALTVVDGTVDTTPLSGAAMPVGMFADAEFTVETYAVPAGARILLYSDGVLGDPPQMAEFVALCEEFAAGPSNSLDSLTPRLPVGDDGEGDDCSVVQLTFVG
ncbi:MAG: PPM-type phosphatase protein [Actinomycetota bacterium]|nr:PPM-type phosphatase protein [Actinomycetota bacterium]HPY23388.1 SpoIIE family protein phosphatase [Mycobacterium sp.]